eukprot:TRINITY_DN303_c0_g2_i1.p1 TRINITY_DN303_c0_g2~~TRINITY_DN303_c0_g2_i1.p1  ORF type:complete len:694 (-),score=39.64 TRINITY_DN303_c0_g2_i1:347-2428(-)
MRNVVSQVLFLCAVFLPCVSQAFQGVNCYGSSPVKFDFRGINVTKPNFVEGNPAATSDFWASVSMPVNLTVAFVGDSGKDAPALAVLQLIKDYGAHMAIHSGDFDYVNSPHIFESNLDTVLGPDFPYFQGIGNHDCLRWSTAGGYQERIWKRMQRIKANVTCLGEVGTNMVCSYKGLVFVMTSYGTSLPTCYIYCDGCPTTLGQTAFIDKAFTAFPSVWRICSWHKNHHLYQIGNKYTEVGLPLYDVCRRHGAIVTTGHEHSYARTKRMSSFENFQVDQPDEIIGLNKGHSLAWVSGIGGIGLRQGDPTLVSNHWWAATAATDTSTIVNHGAVFCKFNLNGELRRAYCETKLVDNRVIDSWYMTSDLQDVPTKPDNSESNVVSVCAEGEDVEVQVDSPQDNAVYDIAADVLSCDPYGQLVEHGSRLAVRFNTVGALPRMVPTEAHLEVVAAKEHAGSFHWLIYAEKTPHSQPFECASSAPGSHFAGRNRTNHAMDWIEVDGKWYEGGIYKSPDISAILMEVFSTPGWIKGNSLTLFVEQVVPNEGAREIMFFSRDRCHAPTLTMKFNGARKVCQEHVLPVDVYDRPTHAFPPMAVARTPVSQPLQAVFAPQVVNPNEDERSENNPSSERTITRTEVTVFLVVLCVGAAAIFGAYAVFKRYRRMRDEKQAFMALQSLTDVNSEDSDDELVALQT